MRAFVVLLCVALIAAVAGGSAAGDPGGIPNDNAAGPAFGYVPSQNAQHAGAGRGRRVTPLQFHGGPGQSSATTVYPVYWGRAWATTYSQTKTDLQAFYKGVGGTGYAKSNAEYTDGSGNHVSAAVTYGADLTDTSNAPSGAPSTSQVLNEVANVTGGKPVAGAYYPVYSDQPRGTAGYCAWHSAGTINGIPVQFGFFFSLAGDSGCDPQDSQTGHSQQTAALGNVSGHELSEMMTDPKLNAWYDQQGNENADKCAWTYGGLVQFSDGQSWKIQGNWSNQAANANSGYGNTVGCIETG